MTKFHTEWVVASLSSSHFNFSSHKLLSFRRQNNNKKKVTQNFSFVVVTICIYYIEDERF